VHGVGAQAGLSRLWIPGREMTHPVHHPACTGGTAWRRDLGWVSGATVATFVLSSAFELHERLGSLFARHEAWQFDELPLTLVALSLGLAWYAWRRLDEVAQLLLRNRELTRQLITVQEGERLALARELHDEMAQHCTAIRIEATCIQRSRTLDDAGAAAQRVALSAGLLQDGVRRLLRRLRPAELDALGLVAALESLCRDWSVRTGTACEFRHRGDPGGMGEAVDTAVFRVTQEALANVFRHADARQVWVELASTPSNLMLCVEDDGNGFDATRQTRGFGLLGAAERAAALGGVFGTVSTPGQGTRVQLRLPDPRTMPGRSPA